MLESILLLSYIPSLHFLFTLRCGLTNLSRAALELTVAQADLEPVILLP